LAGPRHSANPVLAERSLPFQRRIYAAIRVRDANEARTAMREYILESMKSSEKVHATE
jgi:DNA-binding FadR family transcriptional regulator